ncbi:MAG: hypothetical protein V3T77_07705 [Planctomycetota bacterium]
MGSPTFQELFFPRPARDFPLRRTLRLLLRATHILSAGVLLGGCVFGQSQEQLGVWFLGTAISGIALLLTDLHASLGVLFEVRGAVVFAKVALTALAYELWEQRTWLLMVALVIAVVSSHMPGNIRHRVLFLRALITPDERRG